MRRLSLIIAGPREGCPYMREDFLPALEKVMGGGKLGTFLVSFGPLATNNEWL